MAQTYGVNITIYFNNLNDRDNIYDQIKVKLKQLRDNTPGIIGGSIGRMEDYSESVQSL